MFVSKQKNEHRVHATAPTTHQQNVAKKEAKIRERENNKLNSKHSNNNNN